MADQIRRVFGGAALVALVLLPAFAGCGSGERTERLVATSGRGNDPAQPALSAGEANVARSSCVTKRPAGTNTSSHAPAAGRLAGGHFEPTAFRENIVFLASDALEGRGTGTRGGDLAAGYIAGRFAASGLQPGGDNGTYYQDFEVTLGTELSNEGSFAVTSGTAAIPAQRDADFVPFSFTSNDPFDGELVFAGYGQVNAEKEYDDYRDLEVKGKVVLMLRKEPPGWGDGGQPSRRAQFRDKVYEAKDRGAAAVLIVNRKEDDDGQDRLSRFGSMGGAGVFGLPAFQISRAFADQLLAAGMLPTIDGLQKRIDDAGKPASALASDVRIAGKAGIVTKKGTTRNVIAILPAKGDKPEEYVVIGGHYDHLGRTVPGSMSPRGARDASENQLEIHNGADDNASGVSGIIELAAALAEVPDLRRNMVFMAFSGEELGLLGSKHYVEHPTVPLEKTVAMINLDMIGRLKEDVTRIPVYGAKNAPEFDAIVSRVGAAEGFGSEGLAGSLDRSDHASFERKGIPTLFFFTGTHPDYHQPTDDVEKINVAGGVRILEMIYEIALELAMSDQRPTMQKQTTVASQADQAPPRGGAVMRVTPNYESDGKPGMLLDGVAAGGPAATAGLQAGDRILKIGDREVSNVEDYMGALRDKKPGDAVDVLIQRGEQQLTLPVKLGGRVGAG